MKGKGAIRNRPLTTGNRRSAENNRQQARKNVTVGSWPLGSKKAGKAKNNFLVCCLSFVALFLFACNSDYTQKPRGYFGVILKLIFLKKNTKSLSSRVFLIRLNIRYTGK
jgi:hypothetical protein